MTFHGCGYLAPNAERSELPHQHDLQPKPGLERIADVPPLGASDQTQVNFQNPDTVQPWDGSELLGDRDDPGDPEALGAAFAGILTLGITGFVLWMLFWR